MFNANFRPPSKPEPRCTLIAILVSSISSLCVDRPSPGSFNMRNTSVEQQPRFPGAELDSIKPAFAL